MGSQFDPSSGGLQFTAPEKDGEIIVKTKEQLSGAIDSTKVYFIDGAIDMGDTEIEVPSGGMYINGHGYGISGLYSSSNNKTLFKTPAGSYAGDYIELWVQNVQDADDTTLKVGSVLNIAERQS